MNRVFSSGLGLVLGLAVLVASGCGENAAKDKDPAAKPGTNLGSKDIKQARPSAGDKNTGDKAVGE